MALRTLSAFVLFLPFLVQHLTISIPQHVISVFSTSFIISCINELRRLLSMFNDVCYRLFPRLSRIMCTVRFNLGVSENNWTIQAFIRISSAGGSKHYIACFYEQHPARASMDILVKAFIRSGFKLAQTVRALHLALPVEFTCIKRFLSLAPSGCI